MPSDFTAITIDLEVSGCTEVTSHNYNPDATHDDGSCVEKVFFECVSKNLMDVTLGDCKSKKADKALKIYSYYQSLVTSIEEKNTVKVERYKEKLAELCNAEYCKTC
jgi:hypothetical protein